jgi:uncharacterized protein
MARIVLLVLVISLLCSVLWLIHYYVYKRTAAPLGLIESPVLMMVLAFLTVSFPLAMVLSRTVDGPLMRGLYTAAACWLGLVFLALVASALIQLVQLSLLLARHPPGQRTLGWAAVILSLLAFGYGLINAAVIRNTEITIVLKKLKGRKVTIALLTDIHIGAVYGPGYLTKIVDRTNALKPDLVAIAGDLFDGSAKPDYGLVKPLEGLQAPAFFVTGNHEIYEGVDVTTALVARTGVRVLRNGTAECCGLRIFGVDSPRGNSKSNPALLELAAKLGPDEHKPSVLLYHIPLGIEDAKSSGIDLQLSGHTHNGQIFPLTLLMPLFYRFYSGYGREGEFQIYVSHGIGNWGPPIRIGSRSEIIKINLVPAGQ